MIEKSAIIAGLTCALEQFAFMFIDFEEEEFEEEFYRPYFGGSINFEGAGHRGEIEVYICEEQTYELAANVIGKDPTDINEAQAQDAIKELVNIVCGEVSVRLFGRDHIYHLSIPEFLRPETDELNELTESEFAIPFTVDDEPAMAIIKVTELS